MTNIELLAVFRPLQKFYKMGKPEVALEVIEEIIDEAKSDGRKSSEKPSD